MNRRKNQVITNFEKTYSYKVEDGLDQEGTMSPILWRVYYDPLITKIDKEY